MSTIDKYRNGDRIGQKFKGSFMSKCASNESQQTALRKQQLLERRISMRKQQLSGSDDQSSSEEENVSEDDELPDNQYVAEILMRQPNIPSTTAPWHPMLRQTTSTASLHDHKLKLNTNNNRPTSPTSPTFQNLHRSVSSSAILSTPFTRSHMTAIGGGKRLLKTSLAPSGRSALFTKPNNGLQEYLRSHNLIKEDVHSVHLNNFNNGNVNRVMNQDDQNILLSVVAKCRRLRTLEVAGLQVAVRDSLIGQLPVLTPLLSVLDISRTMVSATSFLKCVQRLPLLSKLTCQNCKHLFNHDIQSTKLLHCLTKHGSLREIDFSNNNELTDFSWGFGNKEEKKIIVPEFEFSFSEPIPIKEDQTEGLVATTQTATAAEATTATAAVTAATAATTAFNSQNEETKKLGGIIRWTFFDVSYNEQMTDASMVPLLSRMPHLENINIANMANIKLTDQCLHVISNTANKRLVKIDISGNRQFNGQGLASVIEKCLELKTVAVSGLHPEHGLTSTCLHHLTHLPNLSMLDISGNKNAVGAKFLFALLDRCKTIRCMNLNGIQEVNLDMILQMKKIQEDLIVTWNKSPPERRPNRVFVASVKPDKKKKKGKGKKKKKKK